MNILGINSFFEHPSVALIIDGHLAFAMEDERLTRIKHGKKYSPYHAYVPFSAIHAALKATGLRSCDLDSVAYSYNSRLHLLSSLKDIFLRRRFSTFREELAAYVSAKKIPKLLCSEYDIPYRFRDRINSNDFFQIPYKEWDHHLSHAASAFYCSSFDQALVVVSDGSGEDACTSIYRGENGDLKKLAQVSLPHSLGIFYSLITQHLGFEPFSDEYKVMGLAAYGKPRFSNEMQKLLVIEPTGNYRLDQVAIRNLTSLLGPPRKHLDPISERHKDIAHSAQKRLEEVLVYIINYYLSATGLRKLCLAGGTFQNCVANGRLAALQRVDDVFIQPASHDGGTAIGAAVLSWKQYEGAGKLSCDSYFLGSAYKNSEIETALEQAKSSFFRFNNKKEAARDIAELLANDNTLAIFRGKMEFGPRALGNRSIIASPCSARTRAQLNILKVREQFRPLAPIVPRENFDEFFEGVANPYMLMTARVKKQAYKLIPAVVHADGSARVQVIDADKDPFLHSLLCHFGKITGTPVLINTSFNVRGKPIDESPSDALSTLYSSGLDFLLIEDFLVSRDKKLNGGIVSKKFSSSLVMKELV